jgi:hypothetical protein
MHLIKRGFVKGYKTWSHHGEAESTFNNADIGVRYDEVGDEDADENDNVMTDDAFGYEDQNDDQTDAPQVDEECDVDMEEMLRHIEPKVLLGSAKGLENFETLKKAAKDRMYEGCVKEWTVLRFMLHLLIVKAKFGWSDNSFNELLCWPIYSRSLTWSQETHMKSWLENVQNSLKLPKLIIKYLNLFIGGVLL